MFILSIIQQRINCKRLANKPELLLPESARKGREVAEFARMGADAVVERLSLQKK